MDFKKSWFSNQEKKNKDGSYLKYEEGEVVPVESKNNYPPFLNDEEEASVKQYKDIQREEEARRHVEAMVKKQEELQKEATSPSDSDASNQAPASTKKPFNPSLLWKGLWLIIIGGLVYYSIPFLSYFGSETPDLSGIEKSVEQTKETVGESVDTVGAVKETVTDGIEATGEAIDMISQGSGLVDAAKENLIPSTSSTESSNLVKLSDDQWLSSISSIQNQKQEQLIALQQFTNAYIHGEMKISKYRMQVKGVTNKVERIQTQLKETTNGKDVTKVQSVVSILDAELKALEKMSVSLSSVSERHVAQTFNDGVREQNQLTEQYKTSFKALLDSFGKRYTEEDGVIKYK